MSDEAFTNQTRLLHHLGEACLMIDEIAGQLGLSHRQVSAAAAGLIERGYVERLERGCFQLTDSGRFAARNAVRIVSGPRGPHRKPKAPWRDTIRQRAWAAMRIKRQFTIREIAMVAARGDEGDPVDNLTRYFRALVQAGYLRQLAREPGHAPGSNGFLRFQLVRDTGPRAPVWSDVRRAVHDHNTGKDVPCSPV
ncbi:MULTISPECIES: helix-turn-helix domain-containing protein [Rhodovulum]|uniref:Uncharacterized protein n=2 Tax=Rhodovulum TaxID=34008 RepID=A0A844BJN3_9RHOB|nr:MULTISPECIES: hypothetical protein [Rhodovulum]MRH22678.1 hypothetical protein [Rhodovulum strictum]TCM84811.1 hypothetical protein EV216_110129 [Rhodovulum steppense]